MSCTFFVGGRGDPSVGINGVDARIIFEDNIDWDYDDEKQAHAFIREFYDVRPGEVESDNTKTLKKAKKELLKQEELELNESERLQLNELIACFLIDRKINTDCVEDDFVAESFYWDIVSAIEDNIKYLRSEQRKEILRRI